MTITEFLLARIAEDEAAARKAHLDWVLESFCDMAASNPHIWVESPVRQPPGFDYDSIVLTNAQRNVWDDIRHAYRHRPSRILAECEAKRGIVMMVAGRYNDDDAYRGFDDAQELALQFLALPYADHPDYKPEWSV